MLQTNYARAPNGEYQFFPLGQPPAHLLTPRWAFWLLPDGYDYKSFPARLIGESKDDRCERLGHRPHCCTQCKSNRRTQ